MLALNFGNWTFWEDYNPENQTFGTQKVAFDGPNKIIYIAEGVTEIDVKVDLYSAWKNWSVGSKEGPHSTNWARAFTAIGGEDLTEFSKVGTTYFLENGWRIQPFGINNPNDVYTLIINGNLYTREAGENPFLFAAGVSVSLTRSNLVDLIRVEALGVSITENDIEAIADRVWDEQLNGHSQTGSTGKKLNDNLKRNSYIARI